MPIFELQTPSGTFEVDAPDEQTALRVLPGGGTGSQPANDALSRIRTATGGFLEGIPVVGPMIRGGVERAAAGTIAAMSPDVDYADALKTIQEGTQAEKAANPMLDTGAQIAGAIGGTIPMVMAAPAAFGAGSGGLLARSAASAATGTALGGADAAVRSGGDSDAIKSGALWGFGMGAAGPVVGQAVGRGVSSVAQRMGRRAPSAAQRSFERAASADSVGDVAGRLAAMGDDAMPMDLGPNLQRQAGALAATPGRAQGTVRSAISARQEGAGARVAGALDDALGQPVDTVALADDLITRARSQSAPLYDAAYRKPVPFTRELESLLKRPSMSRALQGARRMAADDETFDAATRGWFANVADDGTVTIRRTPSVYELDMVKRSLDDAISTAQRAGNNNEARILIQQKNRLTGMVDDAVPEYAAARAVYGGEASIKEALEEGQKVFSRNLTPNQLRTQMMRMGEAEKEAFIQGARAEIAKTMGTARNDALAARSLFDKGWNKEKLSAILGEDEAARLLRSLDAETAFTRTRDVVTGNSETAARLAAQADVGAGPREPGILRSIDLARPGETVARISERIAGGARDAMQSRSNDELARLLTSRDPQSATRAIQTVQAAQRRGDISAQRAREIIQGISLGGAQQRRPLEITVNPVP